ncbi:MAG: A24 family peptidase [Bryobacterales bacterium]|nr:A24 family peptidase [Bryobacteraceae bacterium]MDW8130641.1 A24 family peptidase [Bryobacterales bacterium]
MTALPLLLKLVLALLVVTAGVYDVLWRRIPNWLVLPGFLLGLGLNALLGADYAPGLKQAGLGAALAFLIYFPLYLLGGMGAGDVKLMTAIGAIVGWKNWLIIFIFSGILGGVIALAIVLSKGRLRQTFWNLGFILWEIAHLRSPRRASAEFDVSSGKGMTMPHGAVVALGCLFFLGGGFLIGA